MNTKLLVSIDLPAIQSSNSFLYTYPTRLADSWTPQIEIISQPAMILPKTRFDIYSSPESSTASLSLRNWTRNPYRRFKRKYFNPIDTCGLVYDARWKCLLNIAHVYMDVCGPILYAQNALNSAITVIIPERVPGYVLDVLSMLDIRHLATDIEVIGDIINIESKDANERSVHYPLPNVFQVDFPGYICETSSRVFLSRRETRRISNEADIDGFLTSEGFKKYYFEDMPLAMQWSVMRNAEEVVSIHGAGMANLLFHPGCHTGLGPKVVEIFSGGHKTPYFRHYVSAQNGHWAAVRGRITHEIIRDMDDRFIPHSHAYDAFEVDVTSLKMALDYVRKSSVGDK